MEKCRGQRRHVHFTLNTFISPSKQKPPFLFFSCISLSWHCLKYKVSDCSTQLLERRVKQSLGVCLYIAKELPGGWFFSREAQRIWPRFLQLWKAQHSSYIQWLFNVYVRGFSLLHPILGNHLFPNLTWSDFEMKWMQPYSIFQNRRSVLHFSAFALGQNIYHSCTHFKDKERLWTQSLFILQNADASMR